MNRIDKAIDIFLDAVNEGSLSKGTCTACAVGNLVAHGMGVRSKEVSESIGSLRKYDWAKWGESFSSDGSWQFINKSTKDTPEVVACIEATDFTWEELVKIEFAFETNTKIHFSKYFWFTKKEIREDQINGLKAVVEVMMSFTDEVKNEVKVNIFVNNLKLIPYE